MKGFFLIRLLVIWLGETPVDWGEREGNVLEVESTCFLYTEGALARIHRMDFGRVIGDIA